MQQRHILALARPDWDCPETRPAVREAFRKVLDCGTAALGAEVFASAHETRVVYHTCKSRACPSCGYRATTLWQREQWRELPDIPYNHVSLTMPDVLWPLFQHNRQLLHDLPVLGAKVIEQWARRTYGVRLMILVIPHTFGRHLNFNCHLHVLVSEGGLDADGTAWRRAPLDPQGADADVALCRHHLSESSVSHGRAEDRPDCPAAGRTAAPAIRTLVEYPYPTVPEQAIVPRLRGPLCPASPHRTAPVPAYRPSRSPVRDERHADQTKGYNPVHDA